MAFIKPSRHFEGSELSPLDILRDKVNAVPWTSITSKPMRASEVRRLLAFAGTNNMDKAQSIALIRAAAESAGANYKDSFYRNQYEIGQQMRNERNVQP